MKNNGGAAFPRPASEYTANGTVVDGNDAIRHQDGMSLRDYFAAHALMGMIASFPNHTDPKQVNKADWAKQAYSFAELK